MREISIRSYSKSTIFHAFAYFFVLICILLTGIFGTYAIVMDPNLTETTLLYLAPADWIGIAAIAIPTLGALIYFIFRTGLIFNKVESMYDHILKIPGIEMKVNAMDIKVEELWRVKTTVSNSPMVLNDYGKKILQESAIEKFNRYVLP